jgi:hypothetical protein
MEKSVAAAAIRGDVDAYAKPCAADGSAPVKRKKLMATWTLSP